MAENQEACDVQQRGRDTDCHAVQTSIAQESNRWGESNRNDGKERGYATCLLRRITC